MMKIIKNGVAISIKALGKNGDDALEGTEVSFGGRILSRNKARSFSTYFINTGVAVAHATVPNEQIEGPVRRGDIVEGEGTVLSSQNSRQLNLQLKHLRQVIPCTGMLPNQQFMEQPDQDATIQAMFDPKTYELFYMKSHMMASLRHLLEDEGFLEFSTPTLSSRTFSSKAKELETSYHEKKRFLKKINEPKLKTLLLAGYERVYELSSVFRNEGESAQLVPEFTNLDVLQSWTSYEEIVTLGERILRTAAGVFERDIGEVTRHEFASFNVSGSPEERTRYFKKEIAPHLEGTHIVEGYPSCLAPTAAPREDSLEIAQEFRIFLDGVSFIHGYMINGKINDRILEAHEASRKKGLPVWDRFEKLINYGLPPSGGVGVGIEKLVQQITGKETIRHVQYFRE